MKNKLYFAVILFMLLLPATGYGETFLELINIQTGKVVYFEYATTKDINLATQHSITIEGLESDTTYEFRIVSEDEKGNMVISPIYTFKTPPKPETTSDIITDVFETKNRN
jgi:hypothetical protein